MSPVSSRISSAILRATSFPVSHHVRGFFGSLRALPSFGEKIRTAETREMTFGRRFSISHSRSVLWKSRSLRLCSILRRWKYLKRNFIYFFSFLNGRWKRGWCNYNRAAGSIWWIIRQVMRILPPFWNRRTSNATLFDWISKI